MAKELVEHIRVLVIEDERSIADFIRMGLTYQGYEVCIAVDGLDGLRRLAIFHPISRAALAARHGSAPSEDDATSPRRLPGMLGATGWRLERLDDGAERYLALAVRL